MQPLSYVDAWLIAGSVQRPVRFFMQKQIYDMPVLNYIFRTGRASLIDSKTCNPEIYDTALRRMREALDAGHVACIFPERHLTPDGGIGEFNNGLEKTIASNWVPVVPMALRGLWGSYFSHKDGHALTRTPRRLWSRVARVADKPVSPENVNAAALQITVQKLRGNWA